LAQIIRYVAEVNVPAARRLRQVLMDPVLPVSEHPYLYRQSQTITAMREIVAHPNYIVYYRVTASCIEVVNVIHTRREFPSQE
jgi:toxin ParE1/3/4